MKTKSTKRRVRVEINCEDEHCGKCRFQWEPWTPGIPWECSLFTTRRGGMYLLRGDPPRRCKQCLEWECKP